MRPETLAIFFGLSAALLFGTSDFIGGVASKEQNSFTVLLISYIAGRPFLFALMIIWPMVASRISGLTLLPLECKFIKTRILPAPYPIRPLTTQWPYDSLIFLKNTSGFFQQKTLSAFKK